MSIYVIAALGLGGLAVFLFASLFRQARWLRRLLIGSGGGSKMGTANVGISQRGMADAGHALLVFRNFTRSADRYTAQFSVTAVDGQGNPIPSITAAAGLRHGLTFSMPAGNLLRVLVEQT